MNFIDLWERKLGCHSVFECFHGCHVLLMERILRAAQLRESPLKDLAKSVSSIWIFVENIRGRVVAKFEVNLFLTGVNFTV